MWVILFWLIFSGVLSLLIALVTIDTWDFLFIGFEMANEFKDTFVILGAVFGAISGCIIALFFSAIRRFSAPVMGMWIGIPIGLFLSWQTAQIVTSFPDHNMVFFPFIDWAIKRELILELKSSPQ